MRRLHIIILIAALLAACATPAERRNQKPDLDLISAKPSRDVAICISEKWENIRPFMAFSGYPVNLSLRSAGYSISSTSSSMIGVNSTFVLADITEDQGQSSIKFYKQAGGGFGDYEEAVRQCL